jgi:hypothetical protein
MRFACSQCHHHFDVALEGEHTHPERCPNCKAEAGLEPVKPTPRPMALFGLMLGGSIVLAVAGLVSGLVMTMGAGH